ncbi:histidine phosphatase family protein [Candidatus Pacearchaeota archaeon]|nr:histidine phosphatase family protein [Candidatus Pacearchaeota archaeon]
MALKIYLIRHGETNFNKSDKDWGQNKEEGLNDWGISQINKLSERLKNIKFDKLISSDLKRALQTSNILSKTVNMKIIQEERLQEYDPGEVDPSSDKWVEKYKLMLESGMSKYEIRPYGGENIWDLIKRVKSFLKNLEKEKGTIAIVTHSGVNIALINLSQGKEKNDFINIKQDNACINILEFSEAKWRILSINDSHHIDEIKPKKKLYENQEEIKQLAKEYILNKLNNLSGEIYLGGDIKNRSFGLYDRTYKRYKGSPVESYLILKEKLEIPKEWKISSIIDGIEVYEIGKIKVREVKHKVNVSILHDKKEIEEDLEKIR